VILESPAARHIATESPAWEVEIAAENENGRHSHVVTVLSESRIDAGNPAPWTSDPPRHALDNEVEFYCDHQSVKTPVPFEIPPSRHSRRSSSRQSERSFQNDALMDLLAKMMENNQAEMRRREEESLRREQEVKQEMSRREKEIKRTCMLEMQNKQLQEKLVAAQTKVAEKELFSADKIISENNLQEKQLLLSDFQSLCMVDVDSCPIDHCSPPADTQLREAIPDQIFTTPDAPVHSVIGAQTSALAVSWAPIQQDITPSARVSTPAVQRDNARLVYAPTHCDVSISAQLAHTSAPPGSDMPDVSVPVPTVCGKKKYPLKFFVIFLATAGNFYMKFHKFITHS